MTNQVDMEDARSEQDEITILQRIDAEERRKYADRADFLEVMGAVVEALPDALIITDEKGEIILVNIQAELIFGYHRDQLIGQSVDMLVPPQFQHNHAGRRLGYVHEPRLRAMGQLREISGRRRDGDEVAIEIMLSPVVTRNGIFTLSVIRRKRHG
jgi:PAS domain S-box-containing protein